MFERLMETATRLGAKVDTEWAEENAREYDMFEGLINMAWRDGEITNKQYNELASTAFYDFFDFKEEDNDQWDGMTDLEKLETYWEG